MSKDSKVIKVYESFVLGFCRCGCGTEINIKNRRGFLRQFAKGHNMIGKYNHARGKPNLKLTGPLHPQWRGGEYKTKDGYIYLFTHRGILIPIQEVMFLNIY
ncbi:MAG: hypothetical protein ACHQ1D_08750 [Nitrososphaerales archaeon]|jgi:hypothetical protein